MIVDYGVDTLVNLARKTSFPWLLSNVLDVTTKQPLAEGATSYVLNWYGRKVSIMFCICAISNILLLFFKNTISLNAVMVVCSLRAA